MSKHTECQDCHDCGILFQRAERDQPWNIRQTSGLTQFWPSTTTLAHTGHMSDSSMVLATLCNCIQTRLSLIEQAVHLRQEPRDTEPHNAVPEPNSLFLKSNHAKPGWVLVELGPVSAELDPETATSIGAAMLELAGAKNGNQRATPETQLCFVAEPHHGHVALWFTGSEEVHRIDPMQLLRSIRALLETLSSAFPGLVTVENAP